MSRGADDIIREYLIKSGHLAGNSLAQIVAEEIIEALEAEDYLAVHRDGTLMFAPMQHFEYEAQHRARKAARG